MLLQPLEVEKHGYEYTTNNESEQFSIVPDTVNLQHTIQID